uniref:Uncharacterized protein n=1 Tax=viral metagenome TaxID=1070528 RepID=A0A6H1Z6U9_9ZZZZ
MIDPTDKKTSQLFPTPAKRGRPVTGNAKSAAQRKRESRARRAAAVLTDRPYQHLINGNLYNMIDCSLEDRVKYPTRGTDSRYFNQLLAELKARFDDPSTCLL